ncbi:MAG: LLM class flavin-dependent oxidoreductase, partial [Nitrososphaeraceae archaeon]
MTSDHFHPWWHDNAYGNFAWIWIAAAAERTKRMQFVTGVTAPIHRYHPAIIAQAFASLDIPTIMIITILMILKKHQIMLMKKKMALCIL